jgi:hypothetical protein
LKHELIEFNPQYAHFRLYTGREGTVSFEHLALQGDPVNSTLPAENANTPTDQTDGLEPLVDGGSFRGIPTDSNHTVTLPPFATDCDLNRTAQSNLDILKHRQRSYPYNLRNCGISLSRTCVVHFHLLSPTDSDTFPCFRASLHNRIYPPLCNYRSRGECDNISIFYIPSAIVFFYFRI